MNSIPSSKVTVSTLVMATVVFAMSELKARLNINLSGEEVGYITLLAGALAGWLTPHSQPGTPPTPNQGGTTP